MTPDVRSSDVLMRRVAQAMCWAVPVLFGVYATLIEQDANWDLKNYHWYNAYAFLNDRFAQDLQPAHIPTYYNPTLDIPFYILAQIFPARVIAFGLGAIQGLNFVLLYAIGLRVFAPLPQRHGVAALIALIGFLGGGHLGLAGTTFYDNIVSLFVLSSILVVIGADINIKRMIIAGALVGAGVGLKLPTAVFAIGLCAGLFFIGASFQRRFQTAFVFGLGVLAGFAVFAGHWTLHLWSAYANPIFPYFNALFDSPMGLAASYRDTRFVPDSVVEVLFFPLVVAFDPMQAGEIVFRDFRIATAYVVLLITPLVLLLRRTPVGSIGLITVPAAIYIFAGMGLSYLVWLALFGIYRYLIPIEMLAPLMALAALALWPISTLAKAILSGVMLLGLAVTTKPGTWGRVPFGEHFVEVTVPTIANPAQSLVLMSGNYPTAWVIPSFPPEMSFVRIQGYGNHPDDGETGINRAVRSRITTHQGDFYVLAAEADRAFAQTMLDRYALALIETDCRPIKSNLDSIAELCAVKRKDER